MMITNLIQNYVKEIKNLMSKSQCELIDWRCGKSWVRIPVKSYSFWYWTWNRRTVKQTRRSKPKVSYNK